MATLGNEPESTGRSRDITVAAILLAVALATAFLPQSTQQGISAALHGSVLRPFIATQQRFERARLSAAEADSLTSLVDSLAATLSTQSTLLDENRTLRGLLELSERAGPGYLPATVLRPGTPGSESMFIVDVGGEDGVRVGSPVVSPRGLVGVIREVRANNAVGMDWAHPEFRASAMLADGSTYGLVENLPGRFREDDRLILNGVAYNQEVGGGSLVVTSGFAGVLPRGIPIGLIDALRDEQGRWRRSYWLIPMVEPGSATHVLVLNDEVGDDVLGIWETDSIWVADSATVGDSIPGASPPPPDSVVGARTTGSGSGGDR